jgi:hypothetical protein
MSDCITADVIEKCKTRCTESGEVIFNNTKKVDSRHNDGRRVQLFLEEIGRRRSDDPVQIAAQRETPRSFPASQG